MKTILTVVIAIVMLSLVGGAVLAQSGNDLFQQALVKERTEGNMAEAIQLYQTIVQKYGTDKKLAAKALVEMGRCYEKLGSTEARKAYERVVREFADHVEMVAQARDRLGVLAQARMAPNSPGMVVRQVWAGPDVDLLGAPSLDGRYLSFVDWETGDLAIRDLSSGEKRRLTNRPPGEFAFYSRLSPDGQKVAYVWVDKENPYHLRITSISDLRNGIKPRVLYRNTPLYMEFGDWSPDGKYVLANIRGINLISASTGAITVLKTFNWGRPNPRFSPDGRWIVYNVQPKQDSPDHDIFVLAADGSRETPLVEHAGDDFVLGWAPDGKRILFASNRSGVLSAWIIAVADGKPQGAPELVKPDIGNIVPMGFTRTGAFYYGLLTGMPDVYISTLDPATGRVEMPPAPVSQQFQGRGSSPAWSPDGQFIAYLSRRDGGIEFRGPRVICIRSLQTGEERELSTPLSFEVVYRIHWSPDGRFLLATGFDNRGRGGLYRIDVRSGQVAPIVQGSYMSFRPHGVWSPDGKGIFYSYRDTESQAQGLRTTAIRLRDLENGRETEIYHATSSSAGPNNLALSPDGRWLAFGLGEGIGSRILMVMPAAGGAPRELMRLPEEKGDVLAPAISGLEWAGDAHLVYSIGAELWRISVNGGEPERLGLATQRRGTLAIHPDGRQIAFTAGETKQEVWVMENFLEPLKPVR